MPKVYRIAASFVHATRHSQTGKNWLTGLCFLFDRQADPMHDANTWLNLMGLGFGALVVMMIGHSVWSMARRHQRRQARKDRAGWPY